MMLSFLYVRGKEQLRLSRPALYLESWYLPYLNLPATKNCNNELLKKLVLLSIMEAESSLEERVYYINYADYTPLQHRVVHSASLLDNRRPGWEKEVDLSRIKKGDGVLDQLWGSHEKGLQELGIEESEHGFRARYIHETPEDLEKFWEFQVLWRRLAPFKSNPWEP